MAKPRLWSDRWTVLNKEGPDPGPQRPASAAPRAGCGPRGLGRARTALSLEAVSGESRGVFTRRHPVRLVKVGVSSARSRGSSVDTEGT